MTVSDNWSINQLSNSLIVSDGSLTTINSAYGWVCFVETEVIAKGWGIAGGEFSQQSSHRPEAIGTLGYLQFLYHQLQFNNKVFDKTVRIPCGCDNKGVVDTVCRLKSEMLLTKDTTKPNYDVIAEILETGKKLSQDHHVQVPLQYVPGHQDRTKDYDELDDMGKANIHADELANKAATDKNQPVCTDEFQFYPSSKCTLLINNKPITNKFGPAIHEAFAEQKQKEYYLEKYTWTEDTFNLIWFDPLPKAMKLLSRTDSRRLIKARCRWLPTSDRKQLIQPHVSNKCRSCHEIEDYYHIFVCQNERVQYEKSVLFETFYKTLYDMNTPYNVLTAIENGLSNFIKHGKTQLAIPTNEPLILQTTIQHQNSIGWDNMCAGFIASSWGKAAVHLQTTGSKIEYERWGVHIHLACAKLLVGIWENRNYEYHGTSEEEQEKRFDEDLMTDITYHYGILKQIHFDHDYLIETPLTSWTEAERRTKLDWLEQARQSVRTVNKKQRKRKRSPALCSEQ